MVTTDESNAGAIDIVAKNENVSLPIKLYFGIFFDGTSNDMVDRKSAGKYRASSKNRKEWENEARLSVRESLSNGANQLKQKEGGKDDPKYSNVAILHSLYQALSEEESGKDRDTCAVKIYDIYIEGAGTDADYDWDGSVSGEGLSVVSKPVCKAVSMVRTRLDGYRGKEEDIELHFDVFGFGRGAACARLFSYLVVRDGNGILPCEGEFEDSIVSSYCESGTLHFLDKLDFKSISVDFLGIFDTVSSVGAVSESSYKDNVTEYGLFSPALDRVISTFHLCAMDEFREHFALTDIGKSVKEQSAEIFIPGSHSDVGGGYADDDRSFSIVVGKLTGNKYAGAKEFERYAIPVDRIDGDGFTEKLNYETFLKLGWIDEKSEYDEHSDLSDISLVADVNRNKIKCGYSNIPLEMMSRRAVLKTGRSIFRGIPLDYIVDESLFGEWYRELLDYVDQDGRHWYYPGGSFSSASYSCLRKYLHFSLNNSLGFTPSYFNKEIICRYIYHGDNHDSELKYTRNAY